MKSENDKCKELTGFSLKEVELLKEIYLTDKPENDPRIQTVEKWLGEVKNRKKNSFYSIFTDFIPIEDKWYHLEAEIKKGSTNIFIDNIQIYIKEICKSIPQCILTNNCVECTEYKGLGGEKEMVKKWIGMLAPSTEPEPIRLFSNVKVSDVKEGIPSIHSKPLKSKNKEYKKSRELQDIRHDFLENYCKKIRCEYLEKSLGTFYCRCDCGKYTDGMSIIRCELKILKEESYDEKTDFEKEHDKISEHLDDLDKKIDRKLEQRDLKLFVPADMADSDELERRSKSTQRTEMNCNKYECSFNDGDNCNSEYPCKMKKKKDPYISMVPLNFWEDVIGTEKKETLQQKWGAEYDKREDEFRASGGENTVEGTHEGLRKDKSLQLELGKSQDSKTPYKSTLVTATVSKPSEPMSHKNCYLFTTFSKHATPIDCLNDLCTKECFTQNSQKPHKLISTTELGKKLLEKLGAKDILDKAKELLEKEKEFEFKCDGCEFVAHQRSGPKMKICLHKSFGFKAPIIREGFKCPLDDKEKETEKKEYQLKFKHIITDIIDIMGFTEDDGEVKELREYLELIDNEYDLIKKDSKGEKLLVKKSLLGAVGSTPNSSSANSKSFESNEQKDNEFYKKYHKLRLKLDKEDCLLDRIEGEEGSK